MRPNEATFGRAEGRARDVGVLERVRLQAGGVLDGDDALVGGLVGEGGAGHEVADRVDLVGRRAQAAVDLDQAVVGELDAGRLEAERLDVRPAARGDDEVVGLAALLAVLEGDGAVAGDDVGHERLRVHLHALLGETAAGHLGDVGVLGGQHAVERLEQHHLRAEARVGRRDLRA